MDSIGFLTIADGYKVYIVGFATIAFGVYKFSLGDMTGATNSILMGLGMVFGRHTLQKIEDKVK
jgi:hypothetical protein